MKQGYVPASYTDKTSRKPKQRNRLLIASLCFIIFIAIVIIIVASGQKEPTEAQIIDANNRLINSLKDELRTLVDSNGNIDYGNIPIVESLLEQLNDILYTPFTITDLPGILYH